MRLMIWLAIFSLALVACAAPETPAPSPTSAQAPDAAPTTLPPAAEELEVQLLPLPEALSNPLAQFSGMAWYGDWLILLPQYPNYFEREGSGSLVALAKADLLQALDGALSAPLEPYYVKLDDQGLMDQIKGFEGFECLTFHQDQAYLSIEAQPQKMLGYLVRGRVEANADGLPLAIHLEPERLVEIQPQAALDNYSDESCLVWNDQVITLYEANGTHVNPAPVAHRFNLDLQPLGSLPFPNIEYRITDVAPPDTEGRFWAINYLFPGDLDKLQPMETEGLDALAQQYGAGVTHAAYAVVERLVQYEVSGDSINMMDAPPLQLSLVSNVTARNWEGIVRLDGRGFLLVTDSFPETLLGFVSYSP